MSLLVSRGASAQSWQRTRPALALALLLGLTACTSSRPSPPPDPHARVQRRAPDLVLLVVVDQLPMRLLERARPGFTGGLARLTGPESWGATARYHHAATNTCPGHATIATGADPAVHGIVTNQWFDEDGLVYCASLDLLKAGTLADRVHEAGGRVVALSHKDRGALFLAGSNGRAVWYDPGAETFTGAEWAALDLGDLRARPWEPLLPELYARTLRDDQGFEGSPDGSATFPHDVDDPRRFLYSAQAGTALVDLALVALEAEALGAGDAADLLTLSFSNTDYVGHAYTTESWEAMDALVAVDRELGRLFDALDDRLGPGRWTAALTSDHGAAPADSARLAVSAVREAADAALEALGLEAGVGFGDPLLALPPSIPPDRRDEAARAVAAAVEALPGVAQAFAWRSDGIPEGPHADAVRATLHPEHANDVYVLLEAGTMLAHGDPSTGTGHGSPHAYDAHVPFLLTGAGVRPLAEVRRPPADAPDLLDVRQVAPTLAALLGVPPPTHAQLPAVHHALTIGDEEAPASR